MRFHVDGDRIAGAGSSAFCSAVRHGIDAEQDAAFGAGRRETSQSDQSGSVGSAAPRSWTAVAIPQRPGRNAGASATRDADADDAARAGRQALDLRFKARLVAATATTATPEPARMRRSRCSPVDGEDHHMPWRRSRLLARRRLR